MMIAKLAVPLIISRLGEMVSSFLFLAFVGQFIPDALGHASFAWAFVSLLTVVGIGFFSILMIEVAGAHGSNDSRVFELLNAALKLSVFMGFFVTASVFLYAVITANEFQGFYADSEKVLVLMSVSMPAIYLQIVVFNYFNALGQPKFELIFVWFFNILICFVSALLLIFVSELDVISFVAGYVGARWVLVMVVLGFLYIKTRKNSFGFILFQAVPALEYKVFFFKGLPLALCFGGESFLYFFFSVVSKNIGDLELSAYQASLHFLSVIYMISIGIGNATAILTAKPYEQGKLSEFKGRCMEGMVFGVLLLIPCLFACMYFSDVVASMYSSDVDVNSLIASYIVMAVPFLVFEYIYVVVRMVLRSLGDYWVPTIFTIVCLNILGVISCWALLNFYECSVRSIFMALVMCSFVLMVFLVWRLIGIIRNYSMGNNSTI